MTKKRSKKERKSADLVIGTQVNVTGNFSVGGDLNSNPRYEKRLADQKVLTQNSTTFNLNGRRLTTFFQGRSVELGQLNALAKRDNSKSLACALIGMAGVGKTQIAIKYATTVESDFVYLVRAH